MAFGFLLFPLHSWPVARNSLRKIRPTCAQHCLRSEMHRKSLLEGGHSPIGRCISVYPLLDPDEPKGESIAGKRWPVRMNIILVIR